MQILFSGINFSGRPDNYANIDKYLSRSAQPQKQDFKWLKKQGVTDIINFRTMVKNEVDFNEGDVVTKTGMRYHNIPSVTTKPTKENIDKFLKLTEEIKARNGKAHIHCKAGADRTGMYAFIYEVMNGLKDLIPALAEWYGHGYHYRRYPDLAGWTVNFVKNLKK